MTNWWQAIFNPSFPYRLVHMVVAAFFTTGFVVTGVSAWYLRRGRVAQVARPGLSMTLWLLSVLVPLQLVLGDLHGLNTEAHQPAKVAAMEGHWQSQAGAPMILFCSPSRISARR